MRPLETALLLLLVVALGRVVVRPGRRTRAATLGVGAVIVAVAVTQIVLEGWRWQLAPAALAVVLVAGAMVGALGATAEPRRRGPALALGLAVLSLVLAVALPVPRLPEPGGRFPIGTRTVALTDPARDERYTERDDDARRLAVQAWYPASPTTEVAPAPWIEDAGTFGEVATDWLGLPSFSLDHLGLVPSSARPDVPLAPGGRPYPVVIYLHGWGGFRSIQSDLAEELASQGVAVLAADHTYAALVTRFPDGRTEPLEPAALPEDAPPEVYDAAASRLETTFAADVAFVVERLAAGDLGFGPDDVDLERIVLVGHSTGGGAAVLACADLSGCRGVVGFDPWVEPLPDDLISAGLRVPLLSIRSEAWVGNDNDPPLRRLTATSDGAELLTVEGTQHRDFTLLPYLSPFASRIGLSGPTAPTTTHAIVEALTTGFVDRVVGGATTSELDVLERYPQLRRDTPT